MGPNLIVMLTHHDQTVPDALHVFEASKNASAEYWGFKDVGLTQDQMKRLVDSIKSAGKQTCLEVVRYTEQECMESAKLAVECGFDFLMGTVYFESVGRFLNDKPIRYMPFCGKVSLRPSILEGTIDGIVEEAKQIAAKGVHGFDLLAWRYVGDAEQLARDFVKQMSCPVIIAGSIASFERLDTLREIGPWGFTIGSAFFEKKFRNGTIAEQIDTVVSYVTR